MVCASQSILARADISACCAAAIGARPGHENARITTIALTERFILNRFFWALMLAENIAHLSPVGIEIHEHHAAPDQEVQGRAHPALLPPIHPGNNLELQILRTGVSYPCKGSKGYANQRKSGK